MEHLRAREGQPYQPDLQGSELGISTPYRLRIHLYVRLFHPALGTRLRLLDQFCRSHSLRFHVLPIHRHRGGTQRQGHGHGLYGTCHRRRTVGLQRQIPVGVDFDRLRLGF